MQKTFLRKSMNALLLLGIFALTVWSVFHGQDPRELWHYLQLVRPELVICSVLCVILFILGESLVIRILLQTLHTRIRFRHCCRYSFIGFFYSCITPSASGGQPMQVIAMRKDQIPVALSTVVLAIVTITYKLVLVLIGVAVLLIRPVSVMSCLEPVMPLMYLGLALNLICIAVLFLLVFHPALLRKCVEKTMALLGRIRPFKHPERAQQRLDHMLSQYTGTADYFREHKRLMVSVFGITLAQRLILFAVTWLTYRSFRLSGDALWTILLLQAMISVAVDMLPLPGGMGVSENLFLEVFLPIFGAELILPGMMVSRGISYYTQLLLSAAVTFAASIPLRKKR